MSKQTIPSSAYIFYISSYFMNYYAQAQVFYESGKKKEERNENVYFLAA